MIRFDPCGHFLIIELDDVPTEKKSAGGIIMQSVGDTNKREQTGMSLATVVSVGNGAWAGFTNRDGEQSEPWCQAGDRIMIAQFAGQLCTIPDSETAENKEIMSRRRLIKDDDVLARVFDE